jgi:hypothetical protein
MHIELVSRRIEVSDTVAHEMIQGRDYDEIHVPLQLALQSVADFPPYPASEG